MENKLNINYIICSSHRSGSELFCEYLCNLGIAGYPYEPFNLTYIKENDIKDNETLKKYCKKIVSKGSTENGVCGIKILWIQLECFFKDLNRRKEYGNVPILDFYRYLPNMKYIFLTRRDKIEQAVSFSIARRTGVWFLEKRKNLSQNNLDFDADHIMDAYKWIIKCDKRWEQFFKVHRIEPMRILYEDLVRNPKKMISETLDFLEIPFADDLVVKNDRLIKQRNLKSELWVGKIKEMIKNKEI